MCTKLDPEVALITYSLLWPPRPVGEAATGSDLRDACLATDMAGPRVMVACRHTIEFVRRRLRSGPL